MNESKFVQSWFSKGGPITRLIHIQLLLVIASISARNPQFVALIPAGGLTVGDCPPQITMFQPGEKSLALIWSVSQFASIQSNIPAILVVKRNSECNFHCEFLKTTRSFRIRLIGGLLEGSAVTRSLSLNLSSSSSQLYNQSASQTGFPPSQLLITRARKLRDYPFFTSINPCYLMDR